MRAYHVITFLSRTCVLLTILLKHLLPVLFRSLDDFTSIVSGLETALGLDFVSEESDISLSTELDSERLPLISGLLLDVEELLFSSVSSFCNNQDIS